MAPPKGKKKAVAEEVVEDEPLSNLDEDAEMFRNPKRVLKGILLSPAVPGGFGKFITSLADLPIGEEFLTAHGTPVVRSGRSVVTLGVSTPVRISPEVLAAHEESDTKKDLRLREEDAVGFSLIHSDSQAPPRASASGNLLAPLRPTNVEDSPKSSGSRQSGSSLDSEEKEDAGQKPSEPPPRKPPKASEVAKPKPSSASSSSSSSSSHAESDGETATNLAGKPVKGSKSRLTQLNIKIPNVIKASDDGSAKKHNMFEIMVVYGPPSLPKVMTAYHRHADFELLHQELSDRLPGAQLPKLPKKRLALLETTEATEKRRVKLEAYLQNLIWTKGVDAEKLRIFHFLDLDDDEMLMDDPDSSSPDRDESPVGKKPKKPKKSKKEKKEKEKKSSSRHSSRLDDADQSNDDASISVADDDSLDQSQDDPAKKKRRHSVLGLASLRSSSSRSVVSDLSSKAPSQSDDTASEVKDKSEKRRHRASFSGMLHKMDKVAKSASRNLSMRDEDDEEIVFGDEEPTPPIKPSISALEADSRGSGKEKEVKKEKKKKKEEKDDASESESQRKKSRHKSKESAADDASESESQRKKSSRHKSKESGADDASESEAQRKKSRHKSKSGANDDASESESVRKHKHKSKSDPSLKALGSGSGSDEDEMSLSGGKTKGKDKEKKEKKEKKKKKEET